MLHAKSRMVIPNRKNRSSTGLLYIPAYVVKDSSFPFTADEEVVVRIEGSRLVVERGTPDERV
jgi:hypothetical protein